MRVFFFFATWGFLTLLCFSPSAAKSKTTASKLNQYDHDVQTWLDKANQKLKKKWSRIVTCDCSTVRIVRTALHACASVTPFLVFYPPLRILCYGMNDVLYGLAIWNYLTNVTDINNERKVHEEIEFENAQSRLGDEAFHKFDVNLIKDPVVKRAIEFVDQYRTGLSAKERSRKFRLASKLSTMYSNARVCLNEEGCKDAEQLSIDDMEREFAKSFMNPPRKLELWEKFHDAVPTEYKEIYYDHIALINLEAHSMNFSSHADLMISEYARDRREFRSDLEELWHELLPFYEDLHAYVRYQLHSYLGSRHVSLNGSIPGHLQGNLLNIGFGNLIYMVLPDRAAMKERVSIEQAMEQKNWTERTIFEAAEKFFMSLGFPKLQKSFWSKSLLKKPEDGRQVICHPVAMDISKGDQRILMCTELSIGSFTAAHHEMGHVYYCKAYENDSLWFHDGANPAFHEALGDAIFLSAQHESYLKTLGLLPKDFSYTEGHKLNTMMSSALETVALLPFAYALDLWRWGMYEGDTNAENANKKWWEIFQRYQGVHRPVPDKENSFDLAFFYHVARNVPYIRYFISTLLQFQFHDALCPTKHGEQLSECTIYGNRDAGGRLWNMMKLGKKDPWPKALKVLTGTEKLSFEALNKYFAPLRKWLRQQNERLGLCIGWGVKWPEHVKLNGPRCL